MAKVTELQQELDKKIEAEKSSFVNGSSESTIVTMEQQFQITGMHNLKFVCPVALISVDIDSKT